MLTIASGFLVNALITRMISAEEVGAYFLLLSMVSAGSIVALLGMQVAVVRLVAEAMAEQLRGVARATVSMVMRIGTSSALVVAVVMGLGGNLIALHVFNSPTLAQVTWYAAAWTFALAILSLLAESFRGFHDFRAATIFGNNSINNILMLVFLLIATLALKKSSLQLILVLSISSCAIGGVVAAISMRRKFSTLGKSQPIYPLPILKIGLPLMASSMAIFLLTQADLWIIGMYTSTEDVAIYGAAIRLGQLVYVLLLISNTMLPPFISEMHSQGKHKQLETLIRLTSTFSALLAGIVLLVFLFAGGDVLSLVYGEYYRKAHFLLVIIGLGQFVNVWTGSGMITLMYTGHQNAVLKISFLFGSLVVIGSIIVVKPFGVLGVASVVCLVFGAQALFVLIFVRRKVGIWTHAGPKYLPLIIEKFRESTAKSNP